MSECVYLDADIPGSNPDLFPCKIHQICSPLKKVDGVACCPCPQYLPLEGDLTQFIDHLFITDSESNATDCLRNLIKGRPSFLVCGGPSARSLDLNRLNSRGIWSMAVNNMAGFVRSNAFICADPPMKFHVGIWRDPSIMKFIPTPKLSGGRSRLREKLPDGTFRILEEYTKNCPNVWGFKRRSWFIPDETFFLENQAAWGNHNIGVTRTGGQKTVCTMLLGIRLLYYLGSRKIFLIGADFNMRHDVGLLDNYAFGEQRDHQAIRSNNEQYTVVTRWLQKMQDDRIFAKFGLELFNCNADSDLKAFPYVSFCDALDICLSGFPKEPFDLKDWYK